MAFAAAPATDWVQILVAEPILIELPVLGLIVVVMLAIDRRDARRSAAIRRHGALEELWLGMEAWFNGDVSAAAHRLGRAVAADPEDASARSILMRARAALDGSAPVATRSVESVPSSPPPFLRFLEEPSACAAWIALVPEFARALDAPRRVSDALEVNRHHLVRAVAAAIDGDDASRSELAELGGIVASELLRQASQLGSDDLRGVELGVSLGPELLPALFAELESLEASEGSDARQRAIRLATGIAVRLGERAVNALSTALRSTHPASRDLALDALIASADGETVLRLTRDISPGELRRAIVRAPVDALSPVFAQSPPRHPLLQAALASSIPAVLLALVDALPHAKARDEIRAALRDPAGMRALAPLLVDRLGAEPGSALVTVLRDAGPLAADALALRVVDASRARNERAPARDLLIALGADAVPVLARMVGPLPAPADEAVVEAWTAIGAPAAAPLRALLQELLHEAAPERRRHLGGLAIAALTGIGSVGARRVLEALRRQPHAPELATLAAEALNEWRSRSGA